MASLPGTQAWRSTGQAPSAWNRNARQSAARVGQAGVPQRDQEAAALEITLSPSTIWRLKSSTGARLTNCGKNTGMRVAL